MPGGLAVARAAEHPTTWASYPSSRRAATMNWLPPVDPAKISPRVTAGVHNPYTPKGMKQRAAHTAPEMVCGRGPSMYELGHVF